MAESEKPNLILLDVMMPGMDGLAVFEKLRNNKTSKDIPVIFMSAIARKKEKDDYMSRGAAGVIAKPFDPMTLCRQVADIIQEL